MKRISLVGGAVVAASLVALPVSAQVVQYGTVSPSGNYAAFVTTLSGFGASPTTITFDDQVAGLLNPTAYAGVTFSGSIKTIRDDAGPGQGNTGGSVPGEGTHASSPYVVAPSPGFNRPTSFTVSFDNGPVRGAGLFLVDLFNPFASNDVTFEAFTGANGTGTSLGSFTAIDENFQPNNKYFIGFTSTAGDIGSIVLTRVSDSTGDDFGIDDVTFAANASPVTSTPEPASVTLIATGLLGVAGVVRRKRTGRV